MPTRRARLWIAPGVTSALLLAGCAPGNSGWMATVASSTAPPSPAGWMEEVASAPATGSSAGWIEAMSAPAPPPAPVEPSSAAPPAEGASPAPPPAAVAGEEAEVVGIPPLLEPPSLAGLVPHHESTSEPHDRRGIATVTVPGVDSFDEALAGLVDAEVDRYEAGRREGVPNVLGIGWGLVLATGDVLGVQVTSRSYTGSPLGTTTTTSTLYTDVADATTWTSADLVAEPRQLARWVSSALERADVTHVLPAADVVGTDVRFGEDGSITVVLDRHEAGLTSLDAVAVRIPAGDAADVLTEPGRRIRDAAVAAAAFTGVPGRPAGSSAAPAGPSAAPVGHPTGPEGTAVDCARVACIALTFDDGPGPYTAQLLRELADADVDATFFVVGGNAAAMPDLVGRMAAEGHAVGNHTWDHPRLPALAPEQIADEIDRTTSALADAGVTTDLLRPPYGETDGTVAAVAGARGYAQVLWDVDTQDWLNRDVATTTQRALDGAFPGAIVLLHDIHPTTVQAVPGIIAGLRARGYVFVTVPELVGTVEPGARYGGL